MSDQPSQSRFWHRQQGGLWYLYDRQQGDRCVYNGTRLIELIGWLRERGYDPPVDSEWIPLRIHKIS